MTHSAEPAPTSPEQSTVEDRLVETVLASFADTPDPRLKQVLEQDEQIFHAVKQVVIASLHGWPQPLVV